MIQITEQLLAISEVPKNVPPRGGKRLHVSRVYRWIRPGTRGVRLETARIGGLLVTSKEALGRFMAAVTVRCEAENAEGGEAENAIRRAPR